MSPDKNMSDFNYPVALIQIESQQTVSSSAIKMGVSNRIWIMRGEPTHKHQCTKITYTSPFTIV